MDEKGDSHEDGCSTPEKYDTPTEKDRELATRVLNHEFVLDEIAEAILSLDWPEEDRMPAPPAPETVETRRFMANKKPKLTS
ncbi:hypothetical protein GSI_05165 [Ganoderma sinense ZZ0214-1]|uniref:Uncharacterized protein n=1 Tax=Ganoderma sinense ZZ0214-1 TaxID=1077348 RepID=A0A2G8SFD8_9APHY|nr:hypothetical protein GSI_05165 [Ganoderma sinense ZZ0214-1]